ncbi:MAG: MBL fold metallo-hydrolase [Tepidisphaeraceae bacterium]
MIELLFLGTGTSAGVPMIGCHCPVCTSTDPHDRRTRCSVVISYDGKRILVDTTPELRLQCVAHGVNAIDAVVFTHAHADHIMGLDDVRRFNAIKGGPLDIWADQKTFHGIEQAFGYAFKAPDPAAKVFRPHLVRRFIDGPFELEGLTWQPIPLLHGKMHVLGFRVGNLAYCTDVSTMPDDSYDLLHGLDLLVIDALAWHEHPTHFSIAQAMEVVDRVRPKMTYFTHIAHGLGHEETNAKLPPHVRLAYDGLTLQAAR